jgi:hypothetical protein
MSDGKAPVEQLNELHGALAKEFRKRIKEGTATAADLAQARQFLKDNHIEQLGVPGTPLDDLAKDLPFAGLPDGQDYTSH